MPRGEGEGGPGAYAGARFPRALAKHISKKQSSVAHALRDARAGIEERESVMALVFSWAPTRTIDLSRLAYSSFLLVPSCFLFDENDL